MHLSMLSDTYLSDSLAEDVGRFERRPSHGQSHRAGLIRGVIFAAILALPFGIGFGAATLHAGSHPAAMDEDR